MSFSKVNGTAVPARNFQSAFGEKEDRWRGLAFHHTIG